MAKAAAASLRQVSSSSISGSGERFHASSNGRFFSGSCGFLRWLSIRNTPGHMRGTIHDE